MSADATNRTDVDEPTQAERELLGRAILRPAMSAILDGRRDEADYATWLRGQLETQRPTAFRNHDRAEIGDL